MINPSRLLTVALIFIALATNAQIRIEVEVNKKLIPDKPIYMASDLNNWDPQNEAYKLLKSSESIYYILIPDSTNYFEYKFTQGSWNTVEAKANGKLRPNRVFDKNILNSSNLIRTRIEGWEKKIEYVLHLIQVPENTPEDATLYISGNFNNWKEKDSNYKAEKIFDGTYKFRVFSDLPVIEYKINRGNWGSVEGLKNGRPRPNRKIHKSELNLNDDIKIEVLSWEDLQSTFNYYSLFDLLLLFAAFQGILLAIAIPNIQDFNRAANKWLVSLLLFGSIMIFIRVISNFREVANVVPKLLLIPNFLLFSYAPLFYLYLRRLLFHEKVDAQKRWKYFIPLFIQFFIYLPFFFLESKKFQHKVVNEETDLMILYSISWIFGFIFNCYYWLISRKAVKKYEEGYINEISYHQNINYLNTVLFIQMICIAMFFLTSFLFLIQYIFNADIAEVNENSLNTTWFAFSLISYLLGYYAINQPEIFKIENVNETDFLFKEKARLENDSFSNSKSEKNEVFDENLVELKENLLTYFSQEKPFTNPNLTINDLALKFNVSTPIISKVINEGLNRNFFDFVNSYRVNEFKDQLKNPKYSNYTLLGIAFEVGFNSKTSFNRSFKKITNQTPSEYYNSKK